MLDIRRIREDPAAVAAALQRRGGNYTLDRVLQHDGERRSCLQHTEELKRRRKEASREIGRLLKAGEPADERQREVRRMGAEIKAGDARLRECETALERAMLELPNIPHDSVPDGLDESANVVVRSRGEPLSPVSAARPHWELGERLGLFDFERAARMSGSGFPLFRGRGARLQRALIQFMLDLHVAEHGYEEIAPPVLCTEAAMTATGQLPKMAADMYCLQEDGLYLIPTGEVPVTNLYREEIIETPLPLCFVACTPCFRREAGAAGRDTRGLNRVHQFDKVEMVRLAPPEDSYEQLELLVKHAETVLQRLDLPYRVLNLCAGDISFAAAKCYDIELWAPGQQAWLEVSSCSNFEDFQARRAGIRYRGADGRPRLCHTLNGSGVALARLVAALLENGQQADGSVVFPPALHSYLGCERFAAAD